MAQDNKDVTRVAGGAGLCRKVGRLVPLGVVKGSAARSVNISAPIVCTSWSGGSDVLCPGLGGQSLPSGTGHPSSWTGQRHGRWEDDLRSKARGNGRRIQCGSQCGTLCPVRAPAAGIVVVADRWDASGGRGGCHGRGD